MNLIPQRTQGRDLIPGMFVLCHSAPGKLVKIKHVYTAMLSSGRLVALENGTSFHAEDADCFFTTPSKGVVA